MGLSRQSCVECNQNMLSSLKQFSCDLNDLIRKKYTDFVDNFELNIAQNEMSLMCETDDPNVLRCFILHAIYLDFELVQQLSTGCDQSASMISDLNQRVMPVVFPLYLSKMCQEPHETVRLAIMLHCMWEQEDLSGFVQHTITSPVDVMPMVQTANAEAPPPAGSTAV